MCSKVGHNFLLEHSIALRKSIDSCFILFPCKQQETIMVFDLHSLLRENADDRHETKRARANDTRDEKFDLGEDRHGEVS